MSNKNIFLLKFWIQDPEKLLLFKFLQSFFEFGTRPILLEPTGLSSSANTKNNDRIFIKCCVD